MRKIARRATASDLLSGLGEKEPRYWDVMSEIERLDWVASRTLARDRRTRQVTSHQQMRDEGYLSLSQMERRVQREVYSREGSLDRNSPRTQGMFSRPYRKITRQRPTSSSE